jgi:hypothetical protein
MPVFFRNFLLVNGRHVLYRRRELGQRMDDSRSEIVAQESADGEEGLALSTVPKHVHGAGTLDHKNAHPLDGCLFHQKSKPKTILGLTGCAALLPVARGVLSGASAL